MRNPYSLSELELSSKALSGWAAQYDRSKLYDPAFTTEFRRGTDR